MDKRKLIRRDFVWAKKRRCGLPKCGKPTKIESVITGKSYCTVEHRDAHKAQLGEA